VERVLTMEQRKVDFLPTSDSVANIDKITTACMLVTSMMRSLKAVAIEMLSAPNRASFLMEVRAQPHAVHSTVFLGTNSTLNALYIPTLRHSFVSQEKCASTHIV
jgi:hypothetical protein